MTIKIRLRLSGLIGFMLVLLVAAILGVSLQKNNHAYDKEIKTVKINEAITQMRFVTIENLLHHNERSSQQWLSKSKDVSGLLSNYPVEGDKEKSLITSMQNQQSETNKIFDDIDTTYNQTPALTNTQLNQNLQERLVTQLLVKQQSQISSAVSLTALNQSEIKARQLQTSWVVLLVVFLILLMVIFNLRIVNRTIGQSLTRLQAGAKTIASGRLSFRIDRMTKNEFGRVAGAFNSMAESLEQSDKMKTQFIMLAAHQLRTPTTTVRWGVEELLSGEVGELTKDQVRAISKLDCASAQITDRVEELLTTLEIDAHGINLQNEECEPDKLLQAIVHELKQDFANKHIIPKITSSAGNVKIQADTRRLSSVIRKLIANAIMYSPEKSNISIKLLRENSHLRFEITDNGIGIPPTEQSSVFGRFFRGSNAYTMVPDASGLGLYFVKHVVKSHDGKVGFSSKLNHGSMFWFEIPIDKSKTPPVS
jgi:signal transduction histidine kinase